MRTPPQAARHRARVAIASVAAVLAVASCEQGAIPTSSKDCAAAGACQKSGRCTFDPKTKRCIVGSDADCARSDICHIDQRCRRVGDTCDK